MLLQLNAEGISKAKIQVIQHLATKNLATVILVERELRLYPMDHHTRIRSIQMVDDPVQVPLRFRAALVRVNS